MAGRSNETSDFEILRAIASAEDPFVTATEIGDMVGMSRQGAHSRLEKFNSNGWIKTKKVGSKARIWWLTDEGQRELAERASN